MLVIDNRERPEGIEEFRSANLECFSKYRCHRTAQTWAKESAKVCDDGANRGLTNGGLTEPRRARHGAASGFGGAG